MIQPLDVVDAAYDLEAPHDAWLERLCHAMGELYGVDAPAFAYEFELVDEAVRIRRVVADDERFSKLVHAMAAEAPPPIVHNFYRHTPPCGTFADAIALSGLDELEQVGRGMFRDLGGFEDLFLVIAHGSGRHLHLNLPQGEWRGLSSDSVIERWSRLSAHVSAGFRLRTALQAELDVQDAVLEPDGTLVHATQDDVKDLRDLLREAVRVRERARGPMRRESPDEALELWRGLVEGRWSLVDHVDHDGKRFVVARANEPNAIDPRALTMRERQVAHLLARGASTKVVAYSLGLSIGSIGTHVSSIQRKLRAKNRAHLVAILRAIPEAVWEPSS